MTILETVNGWSIGNLCGHYYAVKDGKRIGPFSSRSDVVKFAQNAV